MAAPPTAHHSARLGDHPHGGGLPDYMGWYPARTCDCRVRQWRRRPGPRGPGRGLAARYLTIVGRTCTAGGQRPPALSCARRPRAHAGRLSSQRARCLRVHRRAFPIAGRLSSQHVRGPRLPVLLVTSRPPRVGCPRAQCVPPPRLSRAQAAAPTACSNHHRLPLAWQAARVLLTSVAHEGFR